ncbi:MAG: glycosyltransferase family 4 protein [Deltaproteobacteria bacterium]|nr:glycosyltransferase family 4 protein [Deltaproteobacteria bacterium]
MAGDLRLICVTKRMPHHGARAGYSGLIPHLGADRIVAVPSTGPVRWLGAATRRLRLGRPPGSDWWGAHSAAAELWAMQASLRAPSVVHVMYGEDLLGLSSYLSGPRRRVVATFHQPMARVDALHVPRGAVERLDALIALDEAAAEGWRARFPGLAVHALRLGVDTDFWSPPPEGAERKRTCLVVGAHLRDFEALLGAAPILSSAGVSLDLVGVGEEPASRLAKEIEVRRHVGISDEALLALYRTCGLFLLPLGGASANNALLQAMAAGCPVVCTDLPGIRSYLPQAAARWAAQGDGPAHAAAALALLEDRAEARRLGAAARAGVEPFAWPALAAAHWAVYRGSSARS